MNDKLKKLYDLYVQSGLIQSTDFNTFKSASGDQIKKLYNLGRQAKIFQTTDFNTFSSAFIQPPKKKVTTASPGSGAAKPSSSGALSKAVSAGVQKAVESIVKPSGSYRYPGREDAVYKKTNNQWYIDLGETGNYVKINEKSRISALEKYAKTYTPVKTKEFTTVKSTVPEGVSQKINKEITEAVVGAGKVLAGETKPKAEKYEAPKKYTIPGKTDKEYELVYTESGIPVWNESVIQYQNGKPLTYKNEKTGKTGYVFDYKQVKDPKRVATLNKMFNQNASSSTIEQTYVGYPGKDDVEYRIGVDKATNEPYWEKRPKGYSDFFRITSKGSIDALNAQFNKQIKYDAARDKFSGVAEDVELIKKKEFDTNLLSVNSSLIGNEEDVVIKKLKAKFPTFSFGRTYDTISDMFGDAIEVVSPDGKNTIKISLDNWTDAGDSEEARRLRQFIKVNSSKDLADASKSLEIAEKENSAWVGPNYKYRRAIYSDPEYIDDRLPDQQPMVLDKIINVTKEDKFKLEEKERLARKEYARESYLVLRDIYYKQKKAIETGKNPYDDKEVENMVAYLPNDKETIGNASKFADDINKSFQNYNAKMKLLQIYADDANERIRSGKISEEEFNEQYKPKMEQLQGEIKQMGVDLKDETKYLGTITKSIDESIAAEYIVNEARGTFIGGISKKYIKGLTALPRLGMLTKKEQESIINFITGDYTTEEYMNSKNRSDVTKAIFSLGESLGALTTGLAMGGGPATYASFFAQSYNEMKDELDMIKDPSGAGPSETSKVLMAGTYGIVSSILEKFGLDLALQKTGLGRQITHAVIKDAFMDIPENASKEFIQAAIVNSTKKMFATLPMDALIGGAGEGLTEMTQAVSKIGIQEVYDGMVGSDYFNNKSAKEIYADVLYEGYLGALGGGIMSTVTTASTITGNKFRENLNKEQLEVLMNAAKMENIDQALLANLKAGIISGKYTKEQAKEISNSFKDIQGRINSMPDNMSVEDKSVALDLMTEKANLEKYIANKDESLATPQRRRIAEINVELIKISENAVQEQTTSEVPVQPKAEVSGEMAQGVPQAEPQVTTQEGGQDIREEEVVATETPRVVVSEVINRPATLTSFGGAKLDAPLSGDVYVEGQQVVFEDRDSGKIYELGNVDEVMNSELPGLEVQEERVSVTPQGQVSIDGNNWNMQMELPTQGIEYNPAGEVMNVSLKNDAGQTQMFTGQDAVDIAYQIELQKIQTPEQQQFINDLLEQDEEFQAATESIQLPEVTAPVETAAVEVPVQAQPTVEPTATQPTAAAVEPAGEQPTAEPTAAAQPVEAEVVAEEEVAPEEEVTTEEKPRTKEDIDADVAKLDALLGKTPPKFKKEKQEPQNAIDAGDVEEVTDEMNQLPEEFAEFDVPSNLTTKNKINIKSLISRFGNKLKAAWNKGVIKNISEYNGIPFIFTISDQLSSGSVSNPFTGNTIDINGGLGFNLTDGNENNAWANTDLKSSKDTYKRALEIYNKNKSLFDRLWAEGKLPNGHIPMAVVKMGQASIKTNEALFRLASDTIKSNFNKKERTDSLNGLIDDIASKPVKSKNNKRKKEGKKLLSEKEANQIYKKEIQENVVIKFIKENNFKTIDELLDNMSKLRPIGKRLIVTDFLFTGGIELDKETKPGEPRSKAGLALVGNKGSEFYKYIHLQTLNNIIQEEASSKIPPNHVIAIVGIDVLNGGVTSAAKGELVHGNYPFGMKGQLIGILENPVHAADVFPEMYSKTFAMLKPNTSGELPSVSSAISQSIAVSGAIATTKAFVGAKLSDKMTELQKLIAKLKLAFPTVTIVDTQEDFDAALQDPNVKQFVKDGEVVYGFTTDGKIFLNPEKANSNTAIHEFSHIWMNFLRANNPGLLQKGFDLLEGTSILKQKIKELGDNELAREEAMADLIASRGELLIEAGTKSKFKNWLNAVFNYVKSKFKAFENLSPEEFQKLSLNQFVDGSLASLLGGKEITTDNIKSLQVLFSKQNNIDYIVATARANDIKDDAIEVYLRNNGFSDADIIQAMTQMKPAKDITVEEIYKQSQDALKRRYDANIFVRAYRYANKAIFDRQEGIKRLMKGIKNDAAKRAFNMLITKAGATGFASYRFKRIDRVVYGGLDSKSLEILNQIIYARRIIDINVNRRNEGKPPYTGINGYNEANAMADLNRIRESIGENNFDNLNKRAKRYFLEFNDNLRILFESGRINEETYLRFKDREYSPIKVIKYIIGDNANPGNADSQASTLGVSRKDIQALSDKNENDIIMDSRWLLMMNIHTVAARAFENDMLVAWAEAIETATQEEKDAISKYIKENPIVKTTKDGRPVQKYELGDFSGPNQKAELVGFTPITYFVNGQQRIMVVDSMYANQILDIKNVELNNKMRKVGQFTGVGILRYMATVGNPLFIIGNVPVDIFNATFLTNVYSWFKPLAIVQATTGFSMKFIRGIYDDIRSIMNEEYENKLYREYVEHGGAIDFLSQDGIVGIKSMLSAGSIKSYVAKPFLAVGACMSYLGTKSEFAMRIAVYSKQKNNLIAKYKKENNGQEPTGQALDDIMWDAAREARELVDFSQGGSTIKAIDPVMPYLNASTQGVRKSLKFAKENPIAFGVSMSQVALATGGMAYYSLAVALSAIDGDDEEEKMRKLKDALDSVPAHTKAGYHVVFTGKKDKDGNLQYAKIKKLPVVSILTTIIEQYAYKMFFEMGGSDYNVDTGLMYETFKKSMPIWPTELAGKNPGVAAYIALSYNIDTFTGKEIFKQPRDKKIKEEYQGVYDNKIEEFYKVIAPAFKMSPAKTKVAIEKIITSPSTNPMVHIAYAAMNGMFGATGFVEDIKACGNLMIESAGNKLVKYTDPDILSFVRQDKMKDMETSIESEIWMKEQSIYNKINKVYDSGKEMSYGELTDIITDNFEGQDVEKYVRKYDTYIRNRNLNKGMLDIVYETVPEVQAYKLYMEFGPKMSGDEMAYLQEIMGLSGEKVSDKAFQIYYSKYGK